MVNGGLDISKMAAIIRADVSRCRGGDEGWMKIDLIDIVGCKEGIEG